MGSVNEDEPQPHSGEVPEDTCFGRLKKWPYKTPLFVAFVPLVCLPLPLIVNTQAALTGYVMIIMASYWVTEVIPLAATALLPVVLFPLLGITTTSQVCNNYMKDTIMLLVGGLMVAIAVEKSELHRRIAIRILRFIGGNPKWLMLGFMLPTWFLSMWISNTATTAMMLPIANAVLVQMEKNAGINTDSSVEEGQEAHVNQALEIDEKDMIPNGKSPDKSEDVTVDATVIEYNPQEREVLGRLGKGLTICVAYAANVGGTATLTGTPPNLVMKGVVDGIWDQHDLEPVVSFATWMIFGFPMAAILIIVVWSWLQLFYLRSRAFSWPRTKEQINATKNIFEREYEKLGPMRYAEKVVMIMFILLVLLWFFRDPKFMPGWASGFKRGYTKDALPAIAISVVLFFIPVRPPACCQNKEKPEMSTEMLLDWKIVHERMPWTLVFLLGGGFAMAQAATSSGLSVWIGHQLNAFQALPDWVMIMILCLLVAMLTEVTSNTATCTLLMPIVAVMAESAGKNPMYLMFPVAVSTSFAFMLPVATPPNAIAFATGRITVLDMVKAGAILNVLCVLVVTLATQTWGMSYFDLNTLPWGSMNISAAENGTLNAP